MWLGSTRLHEASEPQDLQVLIASLKDKFQLCCCPLRVCRDVMSSQGLQDLSNAQEVLLHAEGLSVDSPDQALALVHVLEESNSHFSPQGLPFVLPVFFPSQGLVLGDVQDHRRVA